MRGSPAIHELLSGIVRINPLQSSFIENSLDGVTDDFITSLHSLAGMTKSGRAGTVPEMLVRVAEDAGRVGGHGELSNVSLDSGRRFARMLEEGACRLGRFKLEGELGVGSFGPR